MAVRLPAVVCLAAIVVGCGGAGGGGGGGGGGTPAAAGDQPPGAPAGETPTPGGTTPPGGPNQPAGPNQPSVPAPLSLALSFDPQAFNAGLPADYNVANAAQVPSIEGALNAALPATFLTGTLAAGFNFAPPSDTCQPLPPPAGLRSLTTSGPGSSRETLLGVCRVFPNGADGTNSQCNNEIVDDQFTGVPGYTYQNGVWDRFFDGCGPTDLRKTMRSADEVFEEVNRKIKNGQFRCVEGVHHTFTASFPNAPGFATGVSYPFACYDPYDAEFRAYGHKDGHFYYWETSVPGKIVDVTEDGKVIDVWTSVGSTTGSKVAHHVIAETGGDGARKFFMTLRGSNVGPGCGSYIATSTPATGDTTTPGLLYFELRESTGGNDTCATFTTTIYCLKDDFSLAGTNENDAAACTAAGLDTPPASFSKLTATTATDAEAAAFVKNPVNADGLTFADLPTAASIKDPLKILADRFFSSTSALAVDKLAARVNDKLKGGNGTNGILPGLLDGSKQCLFEAPKTFDPATGTTLAGQGAVQLTCKMQDTAVGRQGAEWHLFDRSGGEVKSALAARVSEDGGRLTATYFEATDGGAAGNVISVFQDTESATQELAVFGEGSRVDEFGCGVQFRKVGDKIIVRGKFANDNCDDAFDDRDCLQVGTGGAMTRLPIATCESDPLLSSFEFTAADRSRLTQAEIIAAADAPLPDLMPTETPRAEGGEAPAAAPITAEEPEATADGSTVIWQAVGAFPLSSGNVPLAKIAVSGNALSLNCNHAGGGRHELNVTGKYEVAVSAIAPAKLTALNASLAAGTAFVGYEAEVATVDVVGTAATPSIDASSMTLEILENGAATHAITYAPHATTGKHAITGIRDVVLAAGQTVSLHWTASLSIECPSVGAPQATAKFAVSAPRFFY